jgi:hypothetical protein
MEITFVHFRNYLYESNKLSFYLAHTYIYASYLNIFKIYM